MSMISRVLSSSKHILIYAYDFMICCIISIWYFDGRLWHDSLPNQIKDETPKSWALLLTRILSSMCAKLFVVLSTIVQIFICGQSNIFLHFNMESRSRFSREWQIWKMQLIDRDSISLGNWSQGKGLCVTIF